MPRFLPEYQVIDTRSVSEKVILGISLFILFLFMPATVLGYFSENSLPGQPLYPVKRGIEAVVLAVESVSPSAKSSYYQTLAQRRVSETSTLIAQAASSGDFTNFAQTDGSSLNEIVFSIQQAQQSIQQISDPVQKQQAEQQLTTSIQKYQTQLSQMNYTIEKHVISSPTPTPTPTQTTTQTITQTTPTPTPTPDPLTTVQNQITQTQNDLQTISNTITTSPTPTVTPTPTPTATPTPTPTPTPWWQKDHRQGD